MRRNLNSIWRIDSQLNLSNRGIEARICRYGGLSFTTIEDVHTAARILHINWQVFTSWFACASSSWKLELPMTKNNETKNVTAVQTLQGGAKHSPLASPEGVIGGVTGILDKMTRHRFLVLGNFKNRQSRQSSTLQNVCVVGINLFQEPKGKSRCILPQVGQVNLRPCFQNNKTWPKQSSSYAILMCFDVSWKQISKKQWSLGNDRCPPNISEQTTHSSDFQ